MPAKSVLVVESAIDFSLYITNESYKCTIQGFLLGSNHVFSGRPVRHATMSRYIPVGRGSRNVYRPRRLRTFDFVSAHLRRTFAAKGGGFGFRFCADFL